MNIIKRQIAFVSILAVLLFSSCTKTIDDQLPENEPKLVINGLINPDSVLRVNISKTVHVFENESSNNPPFIEGAATKFYRDGEFLFNLEEGDNGYYSKPGYFPSLNHNYKIEVEKTGYPSVFAETKIPSPVLIQSFDTTLNSGNGDDDFYYGEKISCELKYHDPSGTGNFYRLDCFLLYYDEAGNEYLSIQYIYVNENEEYLFDKTFGYLLWTDQLTDGDEVTINFGFYPDGYYFAEGNPENASSVTYLFVLNSVSEDFYRYDKTRSLYFDTGGSNNPFSEPVLIYTNITNGFGVFGGFSNDTVSLQYTFDY